MRHILIKAVILAFITTMVGVQPALAYIDPNTGGMLFQLLAVIFTFFTTIMLFFSAQIRQAFARGKRFFRETLSRRSEEAAENVDMEQD